MVKENLLAQPPLPNAERHARALEKLKAMSPDEFVKTLVHAGTHTADGKLTPEYVSSPDSKRT